MLAKKTVPEKLKYKRAFLATPEQYFTPFKPQRVLPWSKALSCGSEISNPECSTSLKCRQNTSAGYHPLEMSGINILCMEKPQSKNANKADKDEKKRDFKVEKDLKDIVFMFYRNPGNVATQAMPLRFILNPQAQMKKH